MYPLLGGERLSTTPEILSGLDLRVNPPSGILTPSATRALLDQLHHRPKKQLGQNFLIDGNIVRKSLELAHVVAGDRVVEVGPGLGTLTSALLGSGAEVFAVERDATLFKHLEDTLVPLSEGRLHLLAGDAVEVPLGPLTESDAASAAFKVVANLPYAISSPWMEAILAGPLPQRMVLMLQLEAAQRYNADPGTKSFGAISVFLQAAFRVARGHRVSRTCFFPVPDVDSTLMNLEQRDAPYAFSAAGRGLVRTLFQQRRKQVASLVRKAAPGVTEAWMEALAAANVRDDARAEDVPVIAWIVLDRLVSEQKEGAG